MRNVGQVAQHVKWSGQQNLLNAMNVKQLLRVIEFLNDYYQIACYKYYLTILPYYKQV